MVNMHMELWLDNTSLMSNLVGILLSVEFAFIMHNNDPFFILTIAGAVVFVRPACMV